MPYVFVKSKTALGRACGVSRRGFLPKGWGWVKCNPWKITIFWGIHIPWTSYFSRFLGYLLRELLASASHVWGRWSRAPLPPKKVLSSIRRSRSRDGVILLWKNKRWSTILVYILIHINTYCTLHCTALQCTALHCIALYCIALHCVVLHCVVFSCTAFNYIALHCIASPHHITSHRIASHHITSHHITSHHITYTHIRTYTHTHIHTYTHTHIHTSTCTYTYIYR